MNSNILIAYYSWSGNTGHVAEIISRLTGGSLYRIKPKDEYSGNYRLCLDRARSKIRAGFLPEIEEFPGGPGRFETFFIGTPNWCGTMAPPVLTFLSGTGLAGKSIFPFCTHGGGGAGSFAADIKRACPESEVYDELAFYGSGGRSAESQIAAWIKRIDENEM